MPPACFLLLWLCVTASFLLSFCCLARAEWPVVPAAQSSLHILVVPGPGPHLLSWGAWALLHSFLVCMGTSSSCCFTLSPATLGDAKCWKSPRCHDTWPPVTTACPLPSCSLSCDQSQGPISLGVLAVPHPRPLHPLHRGSSRPSPCSLFPPPQGAWYQPGEFLPVT